MGKRKTLFQRLIQQHDLRCGARTKKNGTPCKCRPVSLTTGNGRCKWHGGMSTGPKTAEGRARSLANLKPFQKPKQSE